MALNEASGWERRSWVESANDPASAFPITNLPFGVYQHGRRAPRIGVAIGDSILDVSGCLKDGLFRDAAAEAAEACRGDRLNELMSLPAGHSAALRSRLIEILGEGSDDPRPVARLHPMSKCVMHMPAAIGDYTDFYASIHHATNVGALFRPDNPLLPNYKYIPIAYHGRASSIVVSGVDIARPQGQTRPNAPAPPEFGPSRMLDYECELGFFVRLGNKLGEPVTIQEAESRLFGVCLVNDWSARDIQSWEYQPLGPFLGKSFATTISPWVVTMEALEPFRVPRSPRPEGDPEPLAYLRDEDAYAGDGVDIVLEVFLSTARMREQGIAPHRLSQASTRTLYWTPAQFVAHHTSNGCNLRPGDLLASGTVSGESKDSRGCLLELTTRGAEPVELPGGEKRSFLEDGDEVVITGRCEREGYPGIGFGECRGTIVDGC